MSGILMCYGVLRNIILKRRKELGFLILLSFFAFLCYSYINEGRVGMVRSVSVDYEGPGLMESLSFARNFNFENMAIGKAIANPLDANKAVEKLIEMEEESLIQAEAAVNGSVLDSKPVFDANGNEIGLRFLIVSDWGGKSKPPFTTRVQKNVALSMAALAEKYDSSFVISLGDNFRENGVTTSDDVRFKTTFEDVFTKTSLQRPWYIIAGDVDYRGNVSAQIEYTQKSNRWNFDDNYYKMSAGLATFKNVTVDFIMIDTVQLCGTLPPNGRIQPIGPDDVSKAEEQWSWINNALKDSTAEYLIVAGHYPVYSGGIHGSTKCLVDRLQPLLHEYHATAYFSGHDHSMQHIKGSSLGGIHYFVSGAASDHDDRPDHLDGIFESTRYFWTNHLDKSSGSFTYCDVRKDEMAVTFVHTDQSVLYTAKLKPRSHSSNQHPENDIKIKAVKAPVIKHHKPAKKQPSLPVLKNFRPKSKQELQKDLRKLQKGEGQFRQPNMQQQRLLQQQQLHAQYNNRRMRQRYRGP